MNRLWSNVRVRQLFVTASAVFCVIGTLFGTGIIGTRVAESSGGELAADATLIAPAGPAFSVWSVVYLGLIVYTIRQWLPRVADTPRHRATAGLAGLSMILNALWLLVTQVGWIAVSVVVIVALLVVCAHVVHRLSQHPTTDLVERVVVDGTFGLYLGWVCVAVCANIAAALVSWGAPATGPGATVATVVVLLVVIGIAAMLERLFPTNLAVPAGIAWGLAWIAVGRLTDEPHSTTVGITAAVAAIVVVGLAWRARARVGVGSEPHPTRP